jgi:hypothetical protein
MSRRFAFAFCLLFALYPIASYGETWDLASDFSETLNPTGEWSCGWRPSPSDPFVLYTDNSHEPLCQWDVNGWRYSIHEGVPEVQHNPNDYTAYCDEIYLAPHAVMFHPGPAQQSVVRWTAPDGMQVTLAAHFESISHGSKVVRIYHNGSQLFSAALDYLGETAAFSATISVQAGDNIDGAIDPISFSYNSTRVDLVLTTAGPPIGACCFSTDVCLQGTEADCETAGGRYVGDGVSCDPDPCGSTPVENTTWSRVKVLFR